MRRGRGRTPWNAAAIGCCALGMLSKEVMVTAPLVALLYDRAFLTPSWADLCRRRWGLYLGLAATWCLLTPALWAAVAPGANTMGFGYAAVSAWEYALSQPGVLLHYLRLAIWPHPLCLDYGWPVARTPAAIVPAGLAVVAMLGLTAWALWRHPRLGLLGACFFLILAPTSSVMPIQDLAVEHRMYLPLAAVVVLLVLAGHTLLWRHGQRRGEPEAARRWMAAVTVVLAVCLIGLTAVRNADYHSEIRMWTTVAEQRPDNPRGQHNLAVFLARAGQYAEAIPHFRTVVRLLPDGAKLRYDLALALEKHGDWEAAIAEYREAVRLQPDSGECHFALGTLLSEHGRLDEAEPHLRRACLAMPRHALAQNNLARVLANLGRTDEAIACYQRALAINPNLDIAANNLGLALARSGKYDAAVTCFRQALAANPDYARAFSNWAGVLVRQGQPAAAVPLFQSALQRAPSDPMARFGLAHALQKLGKAEAAHSMYQEGMQETPAWPFTAASIAWRLATHPEPGCRDGAEALRLAEQACQADEAAGERVPAPLLDALAAACAEVGRFDDAAKTAARALAQAKAAGSADLAAEIEQRIKIYAASRPYRDSALKPSSLVVAPSGGS